MKSTNPTSIPATDFRCKKSGQGKGVQNSSTNPGSKKSYVYAFRILRSAIGMAFFVISIAASPIYAQQEAESTVTIQSNHSETQLKHFLRQAAQNNPEVKAAFNEYLAKLQEVPQVGALPDPEISFGYFINPIETRIGPQEARLSLSQMFPWFGTLDAREKVKINEAKAKYRAFQARRNNLFYEVKATWYDLYVLKEKMDILKENISILETLESIALQKYETAEGGQADVLQVQIELEDLRINKRKLQDDQEVLRQKFKALLHTDSLALDNTLDIIPKEPSTTTPELKQRMLTENPNLNQLAFQEQAAKNSVSVAKLDGLPAFGLGFDYIFTGKREVIMPANGRDAFMARLSIKVPLYRNKYNAQRKQAVLKRNAFQQRQLSKKDNLLTNLEKSMRDYRDAKRRRTLYDQIQIDKTRQTIDILTEKYSTSNTDFEEILRLQRRLLNYQQAREEAVGKQNTAVARIELLTGYYNKEIKRKQ